VENGGNWKAAVPGRERIYEEISAYHYGAINTMLTAKESIALLWGDTQELDLAVDELNAMCVLMYGIVEVMNGLEEAIRQQALEKGVIDAYDHH
jgi:hypothetical protein